MELLLSLFAVLVFAWACNVDTLVLALGCSLRGTRISGRGNLVISAVTTAVTWLSLVLGELAARLFPPALPRRLGGAILVGIGAWFLVDGLRRRAEEAPAPEGDVLSLWGCVSLAAALAVNNAAVGIAAGVTGLDPRWAALANFAVTALCLLLGPVLARTPPAAALGKYALPLSGALLALLGLWELLR